MLAAGCLVWLHQNDLIPGREIRELATRAAEVRDLDAARELGAAAGTVAIDLPAETEPLSLPPLPRSATAPLGSLGAGLAGLVLIVSAAFEGWRLGLFLIPAAALEPISTVTASTNRAIVRSTMRPSSHFVLSMLHHMCASIVAYVSTWTALGRSSHGNLDGLFLAAKGKAEVECLS